MGDSLRFATGITGNLASLFLYAAPILTFSRIIKKKSIEEYSCLPYMLALLNCLIYIWYGLPVVSHKWENFLVVTINGIGILLELCFILIYFIFANTSLKKVVSVRCIGVILVFIITAIVSVFGFHDHHHRKFFVGSIGVMASISMYASPLVVMNQVIKTKSVKFMPFYLSLFSFFASSLWMAYGLLSHDLFIAVPNMVGCPLGILQLLLYCMYRKEGTVEEAEICDLEKIDDDVNYKQKEPSSICKISLNSEIAK